MVFLEPASPPALRLVTTAYRQLQEKASGVRRARTERVPLSVHLRWNRQPADIRISRLRENSVYTQYTVGILHSGADVNRASGCSKRLTSKAAASEEARRTLRYVEPLREVRTPLADFFSILLEPVSEFCDVHVHAETCRSVQAGIGEVLDPKAGIGMRERIHANP
jgi:hypothetical protein